MGKNIFEYKSGLPATPSQPTFSLSTEGGDLLVQEVKVKVLGKNEVLRTYRIPLENIISLEIVTEKELKDKSVLGRGAVGALLLGPVGAVLGGMSGVGSKQKSVFMLAVAYATQSAPGEVKTLVFNAEYAGWLGQNQAAVRQIKKEMEGVQPSALVSQCIGQSVAPDGSITL